MNDGRPVLSAKRASWGKHARMWVAFAGVLGVAGNSMAAEREVLAAVDAKWQRIQSPNFELYSRNTDGESRELLHNLELLRAVFLERFNFVERSRLEVTVYYFRTMEDFRAYAPDTMPKNSFFKGFYTARPDRAIISVAPIDDWDGAQRLIFHEYVHHLFRSADEQPPAWFNEGMAEVLGGTKVVGNTVEIGRPHAGRLAMLRTEKLLPLDSLFNLDHSSAVFRSNDHTGVFYAESWALLHYWYFGKSDISLEAVKRFVRVATGRKRPTGAALRAFFKECFAMDYPEMQKRLERYVQSGSYRYGEQPLPKTEPAKSYAGRPVPLDEIRARLAELALRVNRSPVAKFVLLDAAEKNPNDPRLFEILGADAMIDRDEQKAAERWEQALAAGTTNAAIMRELGLMESRTWFSRFDYYFRLPEERTTRLRGRLAQSIEREPHQSAAYEMLAWVEAFADQPSIANVNRIQEKFPTLNHQDRTLLALAFVRVRMDKKDEAKAMLDQLDKLEPDSWTVHAASVVRARMEGRTIRSVTRPAPALPGGPRPALKSPAINLDGAKR